MDLASDLTITQENPAMANAPQLEKTIKAALDAAADCTSSETSAAYGQLDALAETLAEFSFCRFQATLFAKGPGNPGYTSPL